MGKQIILILVLWYVTTASAQKIPLSYKQVDSTTYALYLKQDWKSVLEMGKKSQKEGIDFYYLKVRMGVSYFKEGKMLNAIKILEEAYAVNTYDITVQEYLYWAYRYSGLILESHLFYTKMSKEVKDKIQLDLPAISVIDLGVLATSNSDYDKMLVANDNTNDNNVRYFPENYQLFSLGLNHPFSNSVNFYHRLSIMPISSVQQENLSGEIKNTSFNGNETRYYADVTFALGNRWYIDTYLNLIFGKYDDVISDSQTDFNPPGRSSSSSSSIKYTDYVFGVSLTKASYFIRNTVNVSISNLNGFNQFQGGYTVSFYPLGNKVLVPFGSVQFQNENSNSNVVYTGGVSINTSNFSITGYGNTGELNNFVANNASLIYNQLATPLSEFGLTMKFITKKIDIKIGYSFMEMEDNFVAESNSILPTTFNFNQQNIIGGIVWKL